MPFGISLGLLFTARRTVVLAHGMEAPAGPRTGTSVLLDLGPHHGAQRLGVETGRCVILEVAFECGDVREWLPIVAFVVPDPDVPDVRVLN